MIQLQEQSEASILDGIRDTYERAIAQVPQSSVKQDWKRYVYLWLKYAQFEETRSKDTDKARQIYAKALQVFGKQPFTFSKLWIAHASFLIRCQDLPGARKLLG